MENNKIKNTIVLRGMSSNIIDEAIVILKPHVKLKKIQTIKKMKEKNTSKELILKEAEHIIEEYVNRIPIEELKKEKITFIKKIRKLKIISICLFILLMFVILKK